MKVKNKIEYIIFDIGNVLLTFNPQELLRQATNRKDRIQAFLGNIILSETWLKMDRGLLTLEEGEKIFRLQFPEIDDLIEFFFLNWRSVFNPISENILIAHLLKQKAYKLYILSNFIRETFRFVSNKYDFFSLFDGKILSFQEGCIKPEKKIYKILLSVSINSQK